MRPGRERVGIAQLPAKKKSHCYLLGYILNRDVQLLFRIYTSGQLEEANQSQQVVYRLF